MSISLGEALGQMNLEAGQVYRCQVRGKWVELRVLEPLEMELAKLDESDIMLDPWVEFPISAPSMSVLGEFGPLPLPDVPVIPS